MADRTSSSIKIAADRPAIMAVIADLESYPTWAGGVREVEVVETGKDGRPLKARLTIDAGPIKDTYGLAYQWDPDGRGVRWELTEKGSVVTELHGSYRLADLAGGYTEVTYDLSVDVRVPMIGMVRRRGEKMIIDSALKGLKRHVER